jgi:hypothetical protein
MKSKLFIPVAFAFVLSASVAVLAHHGGNLYDTTHATELKPATVTKFEWGTPHNQIYFDVKDEKGNLVHWVTSTEPPAVMSEKGWTRKSLKPGDEITAYVFAAKNGAPVGNLQKIVMADGKELVAGNPPADSAAPKKE